MRIIVQSGCRLCIDAFSVTYAIEVMHGDASFCEGFSDDFQHPFSMMLSSVSGKKPFSWWGDVGVPDV